LLDERVVAGGSAPEPGSRNEPGVASRVMGDLVRRVGADEGLHRCRVGKSCEHGDEIHSPPFLLKIEQPLDTCAFCSGERGNICRGGLVGETMFRVLQK
jgi:hypothetical protein